MRTRFRLDATHFLLLFPAAFLFACGEADEPTDNDDQNESQGENAGNDGECPLEYETYCEGADCCPDNCYALQGKIIDVENACELPEDEGHWCISPEIFNPGNEEINDTVPGCYYDDETGLALWTSNPADGLSATGGPLEGCDSDTEQTVYDVDFEEYCE